MTLTVLNVGLSGAFLPPTKEVAFSFVSVCPQRGRSRVNITHNASDLTTQGPQDIFKILHLGPHCTGLPQNLFHLDFNIQGFP